MNRQRKDMSSSSCFFHPDVVFVGVCPLCLNERLIIIAAKRRRLSGLTDKAHRHDQPSISGKKATISISKILSVVSLLARLEFRHWGNDGNRDGSSGTEDDSFISIKFGDNGAASWEKDRPRSKVSIGNCNIPWIHRNPDRKVTAIKDAKPKSKTTTTEVKKSAIQHSNPQATSLRWRKRIGHLFHLIRWKRSSKAGAKVEGVKVRSGWMRAVTKRRDKQ
ncbi:hypothetical protein SAY87_023597 [Trapa incisa]|uniref:Uncharacterized protein n=1 Tax=Trapa incisa TaxID=236973 RepID=A0AAN7QSA4_9MYRT|nr:hypothetical protein SAY87_023597 [Trapa incisa]